jgi:Fe-S-cluster containining protein
MTRERKGDNVKDTPIKNEPQLMSATDYLASRGKEVIDFTKDGSCSNCGGCCGNRIPMMKSEAKAIKKYVRAKNIKMVEHRPAGFLLLANQPIDMICPFRHPDHGCLIYEVRPWICRQFVCNKKDWNIAKLIMEQYNSGKEEFKYMDVCNVRYEIYGVMDAGDVF